MLVGGCAVQNDTPNNTTVMTNNDPVLIGETLEPTKKTEPITGTENETLLENGTLVFGSLEAPHTLHIFTEYHCEYCDDFHNDYLSWLKNDYVKTGKLQIHLTLLAFKKYEDSFENQRLLFCAAKQNKGGATHHFLTNAELPNKANLLGNNEVIGLDVDRFSLCINDANTDNLLVSQDTIINQNEITVVPTLILDGEKQTGLPYEADMRGWIKSVIK